MVVYIVERMSGFHVVKPSAIHILPEILPVTYWDYGVIPALDTLEWEIEIPDDMFTWFLADFTTYMAPTGMSVARIAVDGDDIFRGERLFMNSFPDDLKRPCYVNLGVGVAPQHFGTRRTRRPYIIPAGSVITITLANVYASEEEVTWVMSFYRRPS